MTWGASTMAPAATAATTPPAVATKRRRGVAGLRLILSGSDRPDGNGAGSCEWPGSSDSGAVLSIGYSSAAPDRAEPRSTKWATIAHSPAEKSLSGHSMVPLHLPSSWRSSPHHELPVGALSHVIPGADHRLETREGRVHLFGHRRLLGFLAYDFRRELFELAKHGHRKLDYLDLAFEVRPEALQCDAVLGLIGGKSGKLYGSGGLVEDPPEVDGQCLVGLLVESKLAHGARLVPAGIVVVAGGVVKVQLHVVIRADPLGRIDHAPFEVGEDAGGGNEDRRAARLAKDLVAKPSADAHLEALEIVKGVDLLPEPSGHLGREGWALARHEVERRIGLFPELEAIALVVPSHHSLGVHAKRYRLEPFDGRLLRRPVRRRCHEGLDGALRGGGEAVEGRHDLSVAKGLDLEPATGGVFDQLRQPLGRPLHHVEARGPRRGHAPLKLRLRNDVRGVDHHRRRHRRQRAARRDQKPAPLGCHMSLLVPPHPALSPKGRGEMGYYFPSLRAMS